MPYDEALAQRVRRALEPAADEVREQRMFGGLSFMLRGNMAVGVYGEDLIVRLDPATLDAALARPHARPFDLFETRRAPKGWVLVGPGGTKSARGLGAWVARGTEFARSLPPK